MREARAYYNEIDPEAVASLNELVACGVIAPGDVDSRSIKEVTADDVKGYTQCHFFAGAALWSIAARLAGWPDHKPLWTASCPCQGLSAAGRHLGADDPRHLWPDLYRIIRAARAAGQRVPVLVGEQVAGAAGYGWFDGVRTDLATEDIAARTVDIPACAVDAPHERNRLWWCAVADAAVDGAIAGRRTPSAGRHAAEDRDVGVANSDGPRQFQRQGLVRRERRWRVHHDARSALADPEGLGSGREQPQRRPQGGTADGFSDAKGAMGDANRARLERKPVSERDESHPTRRSTAERTDGRDGGYGDLAHAVGERRSLSSAGRQPTVQESPGPGPRNGSFWADAEWLLCHDGKARRAKPGTPMLVDGMAGRVGVWRLAGNSIVPQLAAEVLAAILETKTLMGV